MDEENITENEEKEKRNENKESREKGGRWKWRRKIRGPFIMNKNLE